MGVPRRARLAWTAPQAPMRRAFSPESVRAKDVPRTRSTAVQVPRRASLTTPSSPRGTGTARMVQSCSTGGNAGCSASTRASPPGVVRSTWPRRGCGERQVRLPWRRKCATAGSHSSSARPEMGTNAAVAVTPTTRSRASMPPPLPLAPRSTTMATIAPVPRIEI
jgi:hypothetical protein